jgi:hypothetical protein
MESCLKICVGKEFDWDRLSGADAERLDLR